MSPLRGRLFAGALVLAGVLAGCNVRGVEFVSSPDAAVRPDGPPPPWLGLEAGPPPERLDAGPDALPPPLDACTALPEQCNGRDDDCDGVVDDGYDLNTDLENCGACGQVCKLPNGRSACGGGRCRIDACSPGFVDLDRVPANGCECAVDNGGVEACDGKDNDCDGLVDEGFDLDTSLEHCGACGRVCAFEHAAASCARGACRLGGCAPGWVDLDKVSRNGCEYACTASGDEVCDGQDNDCDGEIDESDARVGGKCFPDAMTGCDPAAGTCKGICGLGTFSCLSGALVCQGAALPKGETCNAIDDDCDGAVDEDFDLASDPRSCGACGKICALPNAINACAAGACAVRSCRAGFVDLDAVADNGCEYACTATGPEVCDGADNDCDGKTDAADDDLLHPMVNFCNQRGECGKGPGGSPRFAEATFPVCTTPAAAARPDWICNYPAGVELFAPNQVAGQESLCDGADNDCDGETDEQAKPTIGAACTDEAVGECKRTGVARCGPDPTGPTVCDVSAAPPRLPSHEACDGKDNDCDGVVDESWDSPAGAPACDGGPCRGVRDEVAHVTASGADFYVYRYEASRADATADAEGTAEARACSRNPGGGLRPWTNVTHAGAQAACAAAGMRLCRTVREADCGSSRVTLDEWGLACSAGGICDGAARPYPYACTYEAAVCNGQDAGRGGAAPTGSLAACTTGDLDPQTPAVEAAHDMSGNLAEWTEDCRGTLSDGTGRKAYTLRGGSFNNVAQALRCDFTALVVAENFAFADTGFRCCSSCAPGLADCGGVCASLGTDPANCGACGRACAAGESCANGVCR
jgi:hypothetical protein